MLKCPRCGARVKGPDLLTGVCSACQQRLSESISGSAEFGDGDQTFVSGDDAPSAAEGSSLEVRPRDEGSASSANFLSGQLGGSFDLGLTPAAAADGLDDRDTAASGTLGSSDSADDSSRPSDDAILKTFISDQWSDGSSESAGSADDGGSVEELRKASTYNDDVPDPAAAERTFVSDEFPPVDVEAQLRTIGGDADDEAADDIASHQTFVADADDGGRTITGDSSLSAEASDRTFVSDDVPEALVRTLQSNFGDDDDEGPPSRTLKGKEVDRVKSPKSTLVIKTRHLRDLKVKVAGETIDPEYELIKILGEGGMGVVYDARQTSIDRNVALKMIKGAAAKSDKQQAKFLAEAVVTGDLDHPNIVPIYDVGRSEGGALFYSMKKVQGTPWDDVIGEKSLSENIDILLRVADAVAFAHARGVVHRDLKPENTMLGEFGEVLVMDWGLAQPSKRFRKSASITETSSMGGTPAYMAPEMATGPLEKISHLSDVYLLGAILYEILTGKPPHSGKNAMKCLMAAARNEITPTDKTGELIDVARKAMATEPEDRFQSVQAFQAAIREYQAHSESILLSTRAEDDLDAAVKSDEYQSYAKALFGFEEAYNLWSSNTRARLGIGQAQLAYADSARRKGDFDLGLSLLNPDLPAHENLRKQLLSEKQERESRKQRLAALRKMAVGLAVAFTASVTIGFFWISYEADRARRAEIVAIEQKDAADDARKQEEVAKQDAIESRDLAETKRQEAERAQQLEAMAREEAVAARDLAEIKRKEAEEARRLEEIAKRKEEYEAYVAQIGLAAAKIDENAFESARQLLEGCKPELRNWEWGRLMHLCSQSVQTIPAKAPLDSLALSADGKRCASGGWDGVARVWDLATGQPQWEFRHGGLYVHAVAFSPDGRWLATGSDDPTGYVQLWDLQEGRRAAILEGHTDAVLSVTFNRDGTRLLTAGYDKSARLWNVATRQPLKTYQGHTWWVWQAVFAPDQQRFVTVGQDGIALVWNAESGERSPPFTGHQGPVYCAAFTSDGASIVTGGYDRQLLVWKTDGLKPFRFRNLGAGEPVKPDPEYQVLGRHDASIRSLSVSQDGHLLLSGGQDNTVRLWDLSSGRNLQTFRGHDSWIRGVAFGTDGRTLLSASQDATLRTWSLSGYAELRSIQGRELNGHADAILAARYSPDQSLVVTASRDRTARTWDALTGENRQTLTEGHSFLASSARFYDHGRKLVTAAVDNTARLWDVATGTELARLEHSGRAAAIDVSPDQRWIVTGGDDRQAQLWDARTGAHLRNFVGHAAEVTAVAISPDGRLLATADAKGRARLWNLETAETLHQLQGHSRRISALQFSPDGQRLISASGDNTVSQWDVAAGKEISDGILKHPDAVLTLKLSPDGQFAITSCADRQVRVWELATKSIRQTFGPFTDLVHSLDISEDGTRILTAHSEERVVRQWERDTGRELQRPQADGQLGPLLDLKRAGGLLWAAAYAPGDEILSVGGSDARLWDLKHDRERLTFSPHATVASAGFSPDGRWIVTGSWDNSAKIWNAVSGNAVLKLAGAHSSFVNSAEFSPDGRFVLTSSDDGTARLWQVKLPAGDAPETPSAEVIRVFTGHEDRVRHATFSRDGRFIATSSDDKTARLWNAETGALLQTFNGHQWSVLSAAFSPDGQRLITGSEDNYAKIWNVQTGACELTLAGHTAPVPAVDFSPTGSRVLTGSQDQSAKVWDAVTGKEILTLSRHTDDITSARFSPDGRQILTASRDGSAIIWLTTDWTQPAATILTDRATTPSPLVNSPR